MSDPETLDPGLAAIGAANQPVTDRFRARPPWRPERRVADVASQARFIAEE